MLGNVPRFFSFESLEAQIELNLAHRIYVCALFDSIQSVLVRTMMMVIGLRGCPCTWLVGLFKHYDWSRSILFGASWNGFLQFGRMVYDWMNSVR